MLYTLITGASGGIGEALARRLAAQHHPLVLVARNESRLKALTDELSARHGMPATFIAADLARPEAPQAVFDETLRRGLQVGLLVNNAGIGSGGAFAGLPLPAELALLQLNTASLVAMTHLFLRQMLARKSGVIVNVASVAAFMPVPYMATYAASKAFVRSFTEALAEECAQHGVRVLLFSPGLTKTNFNAAAGLDGAKGRGLGTEYNRSTQSPEQVADEMMDALRRGQRSRISGRGNRLGARLLALLPTRLIARYLAGNYRKSTGNR